MDFQESATDSATSKEIEKRPLHIMSRERFPCIFIAIADCLPFQNLTSVRSVADHDYLALADFFQPCDVLLAGFR